MKTLPVEYGSGGYTSLHICENPQNVQHGVDSKVNHGLQVNIGFLVVTNNHTNTNRQSYQQLGEGPGGRLKGVMEILCALCSMFLEASCAGPPPQSLSKKPNR